MNKTAIKNYAIWAREELINRVTRKAYFYGVSKDNIVDANVNSLNGELLTKEEIEQRKKLIEKVKQNGFDQVIEEVAYTWFNRFIALRYMEVNNYLPFKTRVFTNENNEFRPQVIQEAMQLDISNIDKQKVYEFVETKDDEGLFKYLLIAICNDMGNYLPGMFTTISDYKVLLFPDNLLDQDNVIGKLISEIDTDSWMNQVEIIGWLYQFYNIEEFNSIYDGDMSRKKVTKDLLPAATQLFTPDWVVRYMVDNTLGNIALSLIQDKEKYIIKLKYKFGKTINFNIDNIEDLKIIDPCMGSGHILTYMFDVLMDIYQELGWTRRDAAKSIVENNIYGIDIDERAFQLSYFSLMMKARKENRRILENEVKHNLIEIVETNNCDRECFELIGNNKSILNKLYDIFIDSKDIGSAYVLNFNTDQLNKIIKEIDLLENKDLNLIDTIYKNELMNTTKKVLKQAIVLSNKYKCIVTNPPYLGAGRFSNNLNTFIKKNHELAKQDLSTVIVKNCLENLCDSDGLVSMVTTVSWLYIKKFENFRKQIIDNYSFVSMADFGTELFEGKIGHLSIAAWVISKKKFKDNKFDAVRLVDYIYSNSGRKITEFFNTKNRYVCKQSNLSKIPGSPVAYWVNDKFLNNYSDKRFDDYSTVITGMTIGNNDKYLRVWYEVFNHKIAYSKNNIDEIELEKTNWIPYSKGGQRRNWYGNYEYVVNWAEKDNFNRSKTTLKNFYLKEAISWPFICAKLSARILPQGSLWDVAGSPCFFTNENDKIFALAFLCSKPADYMIKITNPTINVQAADISNLPLVKGNSEQNEKIYDLANYNISLSKKDWDSFETSWDFEVHPFIKWSKSLWDSTAIATTISQFYCKHIEVNSPLELCYLLWQGECNDRFKKMKTNEEELNRIFIDIYSLQDELTPEVEDKDVTVRKADLTRDIKSFISYAVGCMFGRYSLDEKGLAFAGGEFNPDKYKTFKVDKDNIIPICDDEYFDDDIVGRFIKFVEVVYGEDSLQENLKFIADALGGKGNPKDVIRNYFLNDFYKDHCKIYQKRPIYWLFDSGKKNGFKALIYIHRYQPDLIARMRTDYVHETQSRYAHSIEMIEQQLNENITTSKKVKSNKELTKLKAQSEEVRSYEEIVHHWADKMEPMNLDDGVKANYEKFKDLLAKIK